MLDDLHRLIHAHRREQCTRSQLMRAVTAYQHWYVLSQAQADGSVALRMQRGTQGEWWISAFSDSERLHEYATALDLSATPYVIVKGSSLFRNLPGGTAGVAFETLTSEAVAFHRQELPWLRTQGHAYEVELALAGTSTRPDPTKILRDFASYLLLRDAGAYLRAPGPDGEPRLAVCTTEDALEAWVAQGAAASERVVIGGTDLFAMLAESPSGAVFNPAGPAPRVLTSARCAEIVGAPAASPALPGAIAAHAQPQQALPDRPPPRPASRTLRGQGPAPIARPGVEAVFPTEASAVQPIPDEEPTHHLEELDEPTVVVPPRESPPEERAAPHTQPSAVEPAPVAASPTPPAQPASGDRALGDRGPGKEAPAIDENAPPRIQHRAMSHVLVPSMLKSNPHSTLDSILDATRGPHLLERAWETASEKVAPAERLPSTGLAILGAKRLVEASIILISMPRPRAVLEAFFIAIAIMPDQSLRYFKLEASYDGVAAVTETGVERPKRANYGFVDPTLPAFCAKLATILAR